MYGPAAGDTLASELATRDWRMHGECMVNAWENYLTRTMLCHPRIRRPTSRVEGQSRRWQTSHKLHMLHIFRNRLPQSQARPCLAVLCYETVLIRYLYHKCSSNLVASSLVSGTSISTRRFLGVSRQSDSGLLYLQTPMTLCTRYTFCVNQNFRQDT